MSQFFLKFLSNLQREKFVKKHFHVPKLAYDKDFTIKLAKTKEELEDAYRLLHDCYVGQKLMNPDPSGLRCTIYTLLPETATIVVKYKDKTVGTVALIKDSRMGLPSDEKFQKYNDELRSKGHRLIEVSSLAVSKEFRSKGHAVQLLIMKYLYHHSLLMHGTHLVLSVHPRAAYFYRALLNYTRVGDVVKYDYVNGAEAVYMHGTIVDIPHWVQLSSSFSQNHHSRNMALWLVEYMDDRFQLETFRSNQISKSVLPPDLMEYFFVHKTKLLNELSKDKLEVFFEMLIYFFGKSEASRFSKFATELNLRDYRMSVDISAGLEINQQFYIVNINDLSISGALIELKRDESVQLKKGDSITLRFKVGNRSFIIKSQIMWFKNLVNQPEVLGFGVKFDQAYPEIKDELQYFQHLLQDDEVA